MSKTQGPGGKVPGSIDCLEPSAFKPEFYVVASSQDGRSNASAGFWRHFLRLSVSARRRMKRALEWAIRASMRAR